MNELNEKYSKNSSLCHIHIDFKQWISIENQLSGFYFKITLTGNKYY